MSVYLNPWPAVKMKNSAVFFEEPYWQPRAGIGFRRRFLAKGSFYFLPSSRNPPADEGTSNAFISDCWRKLRGEMTDNMDDAFGIQRIGYFNGKAEQIVIVQRMTGNDVLQRYAIHELHGDHGHPAHRCRK